MRKEVHDAPSHLKMRLGRRFEGVHHVRKLHGVSATVTMTLSACGALGTYDYITALDIDEPGQQHRIDCGRIQVNHKELLHHRA